MAVIIFGDSFSFPEGNAATNRVFTYGKGFLELGQNVFIICFANDYLKDPDGIVEQLHYYHPFGQRTRNKYFLIRRWQKFRKYISVFQLFRTLAKNEKIVTVNLWSTRLSTHLLAWLLSRIVHSNITFERSEHPLRFYQTNILRRLQGEIKFRLETTLSDGILCISNFLVDYYAERGTPKHKLLLVPSTVDPSRFINKGDSPLPYRYIGYFGSLTFSRDKIDILLHAFAKIIDAKKDIFLVLGGFCQETEKAQIQRLLESLKIKDSVKLLHYLTREEITSYICHADLLVMVRNNDEETRVSYPSKLTEFLATAKPVITSDVGEISLYLKDGENAFLVEPNNIEALAEKMIFVLDNYPTASEVGKRGRELTESIFNYHNQSQRILDFAETLR